ncbi:bifunctional diguanylate cyclase/phosphodiesterase [Terriglobus albidus]|uniref:Bifunctional diguanylate cyclase/phosphodiesterase n=1 Tax=Terriglobus albidus TaxID=1592106 RepID=A0A5B9E7I7_9BACT|nr:bifunctional diguanylate cyclase/phosphodiesterase [Terriglobus albidus]QEE26580.1 bifunctional diguanylate cyclase/phosphodiesterase [Terriglobus albidus]
MPENPSTTTMLFWAVLVLATLLLACWLLRLSARRADLTPQRRQFLAAIGGALLACAIWSLYHLTSFSPAGSFGTRHPAIMLGVSLVVAMVGCGLAVGNVALLIDKQASSKASSGIDALTGLQTRSQLEISIRNSIRRCGPDGRFAVALVDLDRFKGVNDTLGHEVGDLILRQTAQRLRTVVGQRETLARISSDEFLAVLPKIEQEGALSAICRKILHAVSEPLTVGSHKIHITSSIGVAVYPDDGADVSTLLRKVDTALDRAKAAGRGDFRIFNPEVDKALLERLALENDLRHALGRNEFLLAYQPEFDLQTGEVVSMEALLRWRRPTGEFISPAKFIPVAEETGVIVPLSQWVLETACRELKDLRSTLEYSPRFAVNLSPRQFQQDNLVEMIVSTLEKYEVAPGNLELEITEGSLMDDPEKAAFSLHLLRQHGIATAIDDFGTGYSSLSYLRRFPIDKLKMDRAFVTDIQVDKDSAALAESILRMAHQLGLKVVAEGVELPEQLDLLRHLRCDAAQGFLLARPMFLPELTGFLLDHQEKG